MEEWWFPGDRGSNSSGYYCLQAVLTHKGRSSNSGHYVGYVLHIYYFSRGYGIFEREMIPVSLIILILSSIAPDFRVGTDT